MPLFSSKLELTSAASGSGVALADVQFIRGAFRTVADTGELNNIPVTQVQDGQIVWVEDQSATYQASVTLADYVNTFTDTVSWSVFSGFGSGGGGASSLGELTDVSTGSLSNGQVLQYNASTGKWEASSVSGTGDISAVFAGDGLTGGGSAGSVSLDVDPGLGMQLTPDGITLDTGSAHFINAINALSDTGIFQQTGSVFSANADFEITGSLALDFGSAGKAFSITSASLEVFSIHGNGVLQLISQSSTPDPIVGGIYLDNNNDLYIGG
jgi:hypothetical protein